MSGGACVVRTPAGSSIGVLCCAIRHRQHPDHDLKADRDGSSPRAASLRRGSPYVACVASIRKRSIVCNRLLVVCPSRISCVDVYGGGSIEGYTYHAPTLRE